MIQIRIPAEDMEVLEEERYTHPHPRVQRKLHTLYWVGLGYPRHDVARIIGVSEGTVRNSIHAYKAGDLEALRPFNPHPKTAALDRHATTLRETFTAQPPHTVQEAVDRIESLTGVRRSPTQVREWLKNGFSRRKTGQIPAKADPVAQQLFLDAKLTPVLDEAKAGRRHVLFVDAAHFVLGAWLGYLWCLSRVVLPTPSGRQRFNVLGALHVVTHEVITVTNDTYINSESVVTLLNQLVKLSASMGGIIRSLGRSNRRSSIVWPIPAAAIKPSSTPC